MPAGPAVRSSILGFNPTTYVCTVQRVGNPPLLESVLVVNSVGDARRIYQDCRSPTPTTPAASNSEEPDESTAIRSSGGSMPPTRLTERKHSKRLSASRVRVLYSVR
ncbi:hypothetical protein N656DRAFT_258902 [Canariomyces notabilis]|uniref:Uncharacterized protein n=1 Tax=Canariomyces notabilis TaxID=2074819 RepID=A0AAN6TLE7_9PEZI|nr:hypothetical protein N656DRAFT_258902 [Canariomyces arenarius]